MSDKLPEMSEQEAFSVNLFYQFLLLATLNNTSENIKPQSKIKFVKPWSILLLRGVSIVD